MFGRFWSDAQMQSNVTQFIRSSNLTKRLEIMNGIGGFPF